MLYNFVERPIIDQSGAAKFAFLPRFLNPTYGLWGGATPYAMQWDVFQPEQVYYAKQVAAIGLNGVVAGQIAMQPLLDTRGITG